MADPNQKDDDLEEFAATVAIDTNQLDMSPPTDSDQQTDVESDEEAESEDLADMEATMPMSADAAQAFLEDMEAEKAKAKSGGAAGQGPSGQKAKDLAPDATLPDDQDLAFANTLAADNDVVDQAKKMLAESGKQPVVNRSTVVESKENIEAVLSQAQQKVQDQGSPPARSGIAPTVAERAIPSTQASPNVSGQTPGAARPQGPGPQHGGSQNPGQQAPRMQPGVAPSQGNLSPQGPIGAPGPQPTKPASGTSRGLIIAIGIVVILLAGAIAFVVTVALG